MVISSSKAIYQLSARSLEAAARLVGEQFEPEVARVAYFNTLSRMAAGTFLRQLGFEVSLRRWPEADEGGFPPISSSPADRAHLYVRGVGVVECRPIQPKQSAAVLPSQARRFRVGAILVEVSEGRANLEILGFVRGVRLPQNPQMPMLPLLIERRVLESPPQMKKYLSALQQANHPQPERQTGELAS